MREGQFCSKPTQKHLTKLAKDFIFDKVYKLLLSVTLAKIEPFFVILF